jgi:hypothetical protein
MFYNNKGELVLSDREFVNCQRPVNDVNKEIKILEEKGYLYTGQCDWDLIYELPKEH